MLSVIIILVIIIVCINMNNKIKDLEQENKELKEQIKIFESNQSANNNEQKEQTNIIEPVHKQLESNISEEELKLKSDRESREIKNTSILVTGVLFIVIAAIVFLTSTWNTVTNVIKTAVIFLLIAAFWGASKIAQYKFHLPKTSKAFFYISMAYIPICLVSCSFFRLFGNYFSIFGEGRFIYLTLISIILAMIYGYNYFIKRDTLLLCGTILSQMLAVILFTLILETNLLVIYINLLIYNILLILFKNKINITPIINYFCKGISILVAIISLTYIYTANTLLLILWLILAINFILLRKDSKIFLYALNILLYIFGIYLFLIYFNLSNDLKILGTILYILCSFGVLDIIYSKKEKFDLKEKSLIISMLFIAFIYVYSFFIDCIIMKPFLLCAIETILLIIAYLRENRGYIVKNVYSFLIPCTFLATIAQILNVFQANFYFYIILSLVILKISNLKVPENLLPLKMGFSKIAQMFIILMYIIGINMYDGKIINLLIAFIVSAYLIFNNFKQKENKFLRITPILGLLIILKLNQNIYQEVLIVLSTIVLTIISLYKNKLSIDTVYSIVYLFATLDCFNNIFVKESLFIIWSAVNLIFIYDQKGKDVYKALLYCGILALYYSSIDKLELQYNSFKTIGATILVIALLKTIIKNYMKKSLDLIETCILFLIYWISLTMYTNEIDGMIFVLFLVGIVIFSYLKKYGTAFIVSLTAIIINVLVLTREFWFSIPWWIYLLIVGTLLIGFAIKNESDENRKKMNIKESVKSLKEKIEK